MPPEDPKVSAVAKALAYAAGYDADYWHDHSADEAMSIYKTLAREAIAHLYAIGAARPVTA